MAFRSVEESSLTGIADAIRAAGETEESLLFPEGFQTAISNLGGIKLPFRVIGGTTQPSNPKDGDIWVKTSVPIMRTEFANGTWASGGVGLVFLAGTLGGSNPTGTNTTVWAINKNTGADKYVLKITLTGCKQVQGSTGNWVNLDAYRYYGGTWVQFSSEFTATINVTYPAGSVCTATNGTTTLTAPNTSGTWACVVPNAGTWTITATKGSQSKDTTVEITTEGQSESVTLRYSCVLFDAGNQYTDITGGWSGTGYTVNAPYCGDNPAGDVSGTELNCAAKSTSAVNGYSVIGTKNKVAEIANYNTIHIRVTAWANATSGKLETTPKTEFGVSTTKTNINTSRNAVKAVDGTGDDITLDISEVTVSGYLWIYAQSAGNAGNITKIVVDKIWLEE